MKLISKDYNKFINLYFLIFRQAKTFRAPLVVLKLKYCLNFKKYFKEIFLIKLNFFKLNVYYAYITNKCRTKYSLILNSVIM